MELTQLLGQLREALSEPRLEMSTAWVPFAGGGREIRILRRPPLGRGQFGIVFAAIICVAPGLYMPAAMKMAALLDDHVTETLNGLVVDELLDAGVTPGLCYMLDAFTHSTLKAGSAKTPSDWDECVWSYIDEFVFSVRDEVARHYGPHAILEAKVIDPKLPKKGRARVSGGYTFGFIFTELIIVQPGYAHSTAQELLSALYVQFDAIRGLGAVGLHHCDISSRNCLLGQQLTQKRQGLGCILRSEASQVLRKSLYGLNILRFGVDNDRPLAFAHVSNSFEQAREGPTYLASYTSLSAERTPVLIDYGKMRRAEVPAGQDIERTRKEIARRFQVSNINDVPLYVISAGSPIAYDYMGVYRKTPEGPGSALPAISFLVYPTATETSRPPEQLNPFVLQSAQTYKFLSLHSDLSDVFSIATVCFHQIFRYGPFDSCFLVSDREDGRMRNGLSALSVEMNTQHRKPVLKLGKFHPICNYVSPQAPADLPPAPPGTRWATFTNDTLRTRIEAYIRLTLAAPEFAQTPCPWLGFSKRIGVDGPSEPGMFSGAIFTMVQRIQALGVPNARDVQGTFFAELFRELRQEGYDEQSGWLRVALEHTLRTKFQLSSQHTGDLVEDLMACLSWDAAKRPPARRILRNSAFRLLDRPLKDASGEGLQHFWSAEAPTAPVWPTRGRTDESGKLSLLDASEVAPSTYLTTTADGELLPPSERCKMGCRPVATVLEMLRRHGRVPGLMLKEHRMQLPLHPSDAWNVAIFNFNTGLLDYYDGKPYTNFATRQPSSVTRPGLSAAFKHDTTLSHYLETLMTIDDSLIPSWLLPEEEEEKEPPPKHPRLY